MGRVVLDAEVSAIGNGTSVDGVRAMGEDATLEEARAVAKGAVVAPSLALKCEALDEVDTKGATTDVVSAVDREDADTVDEADTKDNAFGEVGVMGATVEDVSPMCTGGAFVEVDVAGKAATVEGMDAKVDVVHEAAVVSTDEVMGWANAAGREVAEGTANVTKLENAG